MAKSKDLQTVDNQLPAHLQQRMEEHAGLGTSQAAEDNVVPMISVLQALSPQLKRNHEKFIEGAKTGDIFLKNAEPPLVEGEEGMVVQPCYYFRKVVEWVPRSAGGGFVAHHEEMPSDAREQVDNNGKKKWVRENGNECIDTRYHVVNVIFDDRMMPYVIPLASSGHQVSRTWHTLMNSLRLANGAVPPSFARLYRLRTKERTKGNDSWFTFDISSAGWASEDQYEKGLALHNSFASGEKKVGEEEGHSAPSRDEKAPF